MFHRYDDWVETLAFEHGFYGEIQTFTLPDGRAIIGSYSMQVFVEVCRVHYLLEVDKWRVEHEALLQLDGPAPNPIDYDVLWCISMCSGAHWIEDEWPAWDVPVARYTQSQVHTTLLTMSRVLLNFPDATPESMADFNRLAHVLMTHNARFFSVPCGPTMLDDEEMRAELPDGDYQFNRAYVAPEKTSFSPKGSFRITRVTCVPQVRHDVQHLLWRGDAQATLPRALLRKTHVGGRAAI